MAYRYRKWALGGNINLVARTEIHGVHVKKGKELFMTSYALNEWDANAHLASPDWVSASGIQANIRRYIGIYDGATRVIRRHHPRIKAAKFQRVAAAPVPRWRAQARRTAAERASLELGPLQERENSSKEQPGT